MNRRANAQKAKVNIFSLSGLNVLLALAALGYLAYRLFQVEMGQYKLWSEHIRFESGSFMILGVLLLLMASNWTLETLKWQLLSSKLEYLRFGKLLRGVLHGISLSMISPGRSGDFAGRVLSLKKENRLAGISLNAAGSISQMLVTWIAGGAGLIILFKLDRIEFSEGWIHQIINNLLLYFAVAFGVFLALFYLFTTKYFRLNPRKNFIIRKLKNALDALKNINSVDYSLLFLYSSARYGIFVLQFYILLHLLGLPIDVLRTFGILSGVYLAVSVLPISNITELSIRGSALIVMYELYFIAEQSSVYEPALVAAGGLLWFINLAIPAFVGSIWIMGTNLKTQKV